MNCHAQLAFWMRKGVRGSHVVQAGLQLTMWPWMLDGLVLLLPKLRLDLCSITPSLSLHYKNFKSHLLTYMSMCAWEHMHVHAHRKARGQFVGVAFHHVQPRNWMWAIVLASFMSTWYNLEIRQETELYLRSVLIRLACRQVCWVIFWLMFEVGGCIPQGVVPSLGWWHWVV